MSEGTYQDANGDTCRVTYTDNGYMIRYDDGRVVFIR